MIEGTSRFHEMKAKVSTEQRCGTWQLEGLLKGIVTVFVERTCLQLKIKQLSALLETATTSQIKVGFAQKLEWKHKTQRGNFFGWQIWVAFIMRDVTIQSFSVWVLFPVFACYIKTHQAVVTLNVTDLLQIYYDPASLTSGWKKKCFCRGVRLCRFDAQRGKLKARKKN